MPEPREGEVLVRVHAAGINPVDWKTCAGEGVAPRLEDPFPFIPGWDVSGVVEALGAGVSGFKVGDAVCGMVRWHWGGGGYAEYVAAPAVDLVARPGTMDDSQAAGLPLAALTAWQALFDAADLQAGQTVLIHAAAGGVGHIAVQLAKWKGARVIGTASARNEAFLRELGATASSTTTRPASRTWPGTWTWCWTASAARSRKGPGAFSNPAACWLRFAGDPARSRPRPVACARGTFPCAPSRRSFAPSPTWPTRGGSRSTSMRPFRWTRCGRRTR